MNYQRASILLIILVSALLGGCRARVAAPSANASSDIANEYDLVYAISHARVSTAPSPFLVASVSGQHRGQTALDIGAGSGRNSFYLARHGYQVTAVDLSHIGLDLIRSQASAENLPINTVAEDINEFPFGENKWDLIALIDFPFAYRGLLPKIAAGLKPGGEVVIQAVSVAQPGLESPDKMLHYTFMDRRDLAAPFAGFTVLHHSEDEEPTVWGVKAIMVRFSARKPG
ncbi:MAG TPA: class I SAM-dependent methyltransferase [Terriglobales bacterium]|nr:class I SAM-dependent methyltransferase [Terriglobales bacterium]